MRWDNNHGATVVVRNDDRHRPIFYAPPPLSTCLISRRIDRLRTYGNDGTFAEVSILSTGVDLDRWAQAFLSSLEWTIRTAAAAERSSEIQECYDLFVDAKADLADSISRAIDFVYATPAGAGDPRSAQQTLRRALLDGLENAYGVSTVVQLEAVLDVHGNIEPPGDPRFPPMILGQVDDGALAERGQPACSLSNSTIPLRAGDTWLNFLVSPTDPGARRAFNPDVTCQTAFTENDLLERDGGAGASTTPAGHVGQIRIPIPLRAFPEAPALRNASAEQQVAPLDIKTVDQALEWRYSVGVARPTIAQDTLHLQVAFNEPVIAEQILSPATSLPDMGRSAAGDLYEGLARYAFEYPQLLPHLTNIPSGGDARTGFALQCFSELVADVAGTWAEWQSPQASVAPPPAPENLQELWTFSIEQEDDGETLALTASWMRAVGEPPEWQPVPGAPAWPSISGYTRRAVAADRTHAVYVLTAPKVPADLTFEWERLFVLDYRSARPQAWIERNGNLAPPGHSTNPRFIYRSEMCALPGPVAPLIRTSNPIAIDPGTSLQNAVLAWLIAMRSPPPGAQAGPGGSALQIETSVGYSSALFSDKDVTLSSQPPLFRAQQSIASGQDRTAAAEIAGALSEWKRNAQPSMDGAAIWFRVDVFAKRIADTRTLPLVQLPQVTLTVSADPQWWDTGAAAIE